MPENLDRSPDLLDPEKYFKNRFKELFENPFNTESKPGRRYAELLQKIPALTGKEECLDLGCGAGLGTWMIAQSAKFALGIDNTALAIDFANKHYCRKGKIEFLVADLAALKLERKFDRVFLIHTLEHIPAKPGSDLISMIYRILKPGGMLHISVPTEATLISRYERLMEWIKNIPPWDPTHITRFTIPGLETLGNKAGFKILPIERRLFPSKKLRRLHQKIHFPTWVQNPLTEEAFITLLKS